MSTQHELARDGADPIEKVDALLNLLDSVGDDATVRSELYDLIERDSVARRHYIEAIELRTSLHIMMEGSEADVDAMLNMRRPPSNGPKPWLFISSIATSIAATVVVTLFLQQQWKRDDALIAKDIIVPDVAPAANVKPVVAPKQQDVCARVDGMSLGITEDIFAPDYIVRAGDIITLGETGDSWVRFSTAADATLLVVGPAIGHFASPSEFVLESGRVLGEDRSLSPDKLRIRIGETIVSDLGTRFGVAVDSNQVDVEVFDGAVSVATSGESVVDSLSYGMGLTYSAKGARKPVIRELAEHPKLANLNEMLAGIVATDGDVKFNPIMPSTVAGGLRTDDGSIHVFEESGNVRLDRSIPVSHVLSASDGHEIEIVCSGPSDGNKRRTSFAPDKPLRSFLMHFENASGTRARGFVEFDRPIVAVIGDAELLTATDPLVGRMSIQYPEHKSAETRGVESDAAEAEPDWRDKIIVSHGRTRLSVDLIVGHGVDQLRVLLEESR